MTNSLTRELFRATALTFDSLAFAIVSSEMPPADVEPRLDGAVEVGFHGSFGGRLVLGVSGGILPGLAANMLGDEDSMTPQAQWDALGEMANVICGNVLTGIAGREGSFLLDAPKRVGELGLSAPSDVETARIQLGLEEGRADVLLVLDRAPAPIVEGPNP
jgi:CheY-specific phosphatase CheX